MTILDDLKAIKKLDPSNVLESTAMFPDQCNQAWQESSKIHFPERFKKARNIVVCGMGGSRFTPKTIKYLFIDRITVPYEIIEGYSLPRYVGKNTLVILSSYSGTTEEVVACGMDAVKRGAMMTAVTKGGTLEKLMNESDLPFYKLDPKHNPSGQPRIAGGYLLMGHAGVLSSLGYLNINEEEINKAIAFAREVGKRYLADVKTENNQAKKLGSFLIDKHPIIITSEFLRGFGNGFANQINETAKLISDYRYIPELNHHLMEGLKRPDTLHKTGVFVFINSKLYSDRVQKRYKITKEVVEKQEVNTHSINLQGTSKLAQILEAFTLSGFTTFYMAMLYKTDPVAIPWVDYFKKKLGQPLQ